MSAVRGSVLISLAITLAALHMIAPDHWIPVSVVSARRRYGAGRMALASVGLGSAHGATTVALAAIALATGELYPALPHLADGISIALLVAVALYFLASSAYEANPGRFEGASLAASVLPDPALLPLAFSSIAYGPGLVWALSAAYAAAGAASLALVASLAHRGLTGALSRLSPRAVDAAIAAMLLATAVYVYVAG